MDNRRIRKTYDRDFKVSAMRLILEKHPSVAKVEKWTPKTGQAIKL